MQHPSNCDVYNAVLRRLLPHGFARLVIVGFTVWPDIEEPALPAITVDFIRCKLSAVRPDTLSAFRIACEQTTKLDHASFTDSEHLTVTRQAFGECYDLKQIRTDFPEGDGIVMVSGVGFSTDCTQALVYASIQPHQSFPNGGFGLFMLASRRDDSWIVEEEAEAWIS